MQIRQNFRKIDFVKNLAFVVILIICAIRIDITHALNIDLFTNSKVFILVHAEKSAIATVQPSLSPSHSSNATENVGSLASDVIEIEKRKQLQCLFSFSINEFICYKN